MAKPNKTAADYMVIGLSPVLIMLLVGSLCFFLVEVFYRGQSAGGLTWVLGWYVLAIVLISRIAIEQTNQQAAMYGFLLAMATWFYMMRSQPGWLFGVILLAIVWFCAHKLVFDCTLIDEDQDSSGHGLLQKSVLKPEAKAPPEKNPLAKRPRKLTPPQNPGRWVVYFSLAAIPLFGVGQVLLPADAANSRRWGFIFLTLYLFAALGLLVTTSFLGMRRYLRQRFLKMPPSIALAWLKFGVGVLIIVMAGSVLLPRPGATAAWAALSYKINSVLLQASKYASPANHPGQGEGKPGNETGGKEGSAPKPSQEEQSGPKSPQKKPGETPSPSKPEPGQFKPTAPTGNMYNLLRAGFWIAVALVIGTWIVRQRNFLLEIIRSIIEAIRQFIRKFLAMDLGRKSAAKTEAAPVRMKLSTFAEYKNPFFAAKDHIWPPEQIIIYTYEAVRVWAKEQGAAPNPQETAREFCQRLGGRFGVLDPHLHQLSRLYAHAAYGKNIPLDSDLEPIKELWRQLPTAGIKVMTSA
jgi:hypothetical protein